MKKIHLMVCLILCLCTMPVPVVSAAGINQGWIQIFCNVDGASVFFDDHFQGLILDGQLVVPVYMAVPVHAFRVEKEGFTTAAGSLTMPEPGATAIAYATIRPLSTPTTVPTSMYGSISVNTSPQGAKIYLDGFYRGISPFAFDQIEPGSHSIEAVLDGYYRYSTMIGIAAGSNTDVYFTLEAVSSSPNTLNITSDPTHAFVYLDKIYKGKTPLTVDDVDTGNHEIELITPGYHTWSETVSFPRGGTTRSISAIMVSLLPAGTTTPETVTLTPVPTTTILKTPTTAVTKAGTGPAMIFGAVGILGLAAGFIRRKKK